MLAWARGSGGGRSLALNAHMDTVGTDGMERPLEPRIADGRLYGRGSFDMKGSLAAAMVATKEAPRLGLAGDVVLTAVIDEEVASHGTTAALVRLRPDAAIVCEPTQLRVAVAHRGFVGFEIVTHGVAAHGSRPDLGVDAIVKMGHVLVGLGALDHSLRDGPVHPLLRSGSLHAGVVQGGVGFSTYPDRCLLQGERRTVPGETLEQVEGELVAVLAAAARDDPEFRGEWRVVLARSPFEVSERQEVVRLVLRHAGEAAGVGETYWADSALYDEAAVPAVLFGPSGRARTPTSSGSISRASSAASRSTRPSPPTSAAERRQLTRLSRPSACWFHGTRCVDAGARASRTVGEVPVVGAAERLRIRQPRRPAEQPLCLCTSTKESR